MPPKAKITREMILDAAYEIVRKLGAENVNARSIAKSLGCSTQPVLYYFATVEEIKKAVYARADAFHTEYITDIRPERGDPMLQIGSNYIRYAAQERNLFRFLFQSNGFQDKGFIELIDAPELAPVLFVLRQAAGVGEKQAKDVFCSIFLVAHGYASLFANNAMEYNEDAIDAQLQKAFIGAVYAAREEEDNV